MSRRKKKSGEETKQEDTVEIEPREEDLQASANEETIDPLGVTMPVPEMPAPEYEPPAVEETVPVEPKEPRARRTELPDRTPLMTAERMFRGRSREAVVKAFLAVERLRGRTRKLTRAEWDQEFTAFLKAKR